jgi:5'-nucleotidase
LETRFTIHRTHETAYGNFVADLMRLYVNSDIALANSGSIRNDCILPAGPLKYSEVSNIINDALVVKALPGKVVLQALEHSIKGLPAGFNGSFLHVSGVTFKFNSNLPPGSRIIEVKVNGYDLEFESIYSVVMTSYMSKGGDGFDFLKD